MLIGPNSQKTLRPKLLEKLRLMESVLENAHDAVLITEAEPLDHPGPIILYVNPAFTRMTGYSSEDAVGRNPRFLQGPLSGRDSLDKIKEALRTWSAVEVELLNYRKDGTTFWVELSIAPIADETGAYRHWISVQRDITERKTNEETLARLQLTDVQNRVLTDQIEQRKQMEASLSHAAYHDALTGLPNRVFFNEHLEQMLAQDRSRADKGAVVLYLDLDGFKGINDTLGHRVGDLFLIEIGNRLKGCVRPQDTLARMGGDEFTLLLHHCAVQQALEVADRLLHALAQPIKLASVNLQVSCSIGLRVMTTACTDGQEVMRDADIAMYQAKREGGGRCAVFRPDMKEDAHSVLRTTSELQAALDGDEFELYYQPIVDLQDASVHGVEALIRWNHPTRGLLHPEDFIPLTEEIGLIVPIGRWVLRQAVIDQHALEAAWRSNRPDASILKVSVNVSTRQLDTEDFLADLFSLLEETAMDPRKLQLEITESVYLKDAPRLSEILRAIRSAGVQIAFDDFGTGYSSISYLERYPVDALKVDKWFVGNLLSGPKTAEVIRLMIELAAVFNMTVSAEGVETEEQAAMLRQAGCRLAQGYHYGTPLPLGEMAALLANAA